MDSELELPCLVCANCGCRGPFFYYQTDRAGGWVDGSGHLWEDDRHRLYSWRGWKRPRYVRVSSLVCDRCGKSSVRRARTRAEYALLLLGAAEKNQDAAR